MTTLIGIQAHPAPASILIIIIITTGRLPSKSSLHLKLVCKNNDGISIIDDDRMSQSQQETTTGATASSSVVLYNFRTDATIKIQVSHSTMTGLPSSLSFQEGMQTFCLVLKRFSLYVPN